MTKKGKGRQASGFRSKAERGRRWSQVLSESAEEGRHHDVKAAKERNYERPRAVLLQQASTLSFLLSQRDTSGMPPDRDSRAAAALPPPPPAASEMSAASPPRPHVGPAKSLAEMCVDVVGSHFSAFAEVREDFEEVFLSLPAPQLERIAAVASRDGELMNGNLGLVCGSEVGGLRLHGSLQQKGLEALMPTADVGGGAAGDELDDWEDHDDILGVPEARGCLRLTSLELHSPLLTAAAFDAVIPSLTGLKRLSLLGCFHGTTTIARHMRTEAQACDLEGEEDTDGGGAAVLFVSVPKLTGLTHLDVSFSPWFKNELLLDFVRFLAPSSQRGAAEVQFSLRAKYFPVFADDSNPGTKTEIAAGAALRHLRLVVCQHTGVTEPVRDQAEQWLDKYLDADAAMEEALPVAEAETTTLMSMPMTPEGSTSTSSAATAGAGNRGEGAGSAGSGGGRTAPRPTRRRRLRLRMSSESE